MKSSLPIYIAIMVIGMVFSLTACKDEGPAEKAGEQIDDAAEEAKEKARQAKKAVEEAVKY